MKTFLDIIPPNTPLHHAYFVVGDYKKIIPKLHSFLEQRFGIGFTSSANPDFNVREYSSWGVDESRDLKIFHSRRPVSWPVKVSIIIPETITLEAQNSLLKTLEEPTPSTHFFIIAKRLGEFLPTVVSRCQVIKFETGVFPTELGELAKEFLSGDVAKRFEINKIILKQQENDSVCSQDWLNCLLDIYWNKVSDQSDKKAVTSEKALVDAIFYASSRGSSLRVILDHIALIVSTV